MDATAEPRVKHKSFKFETRLLWKRDKLGLLSSSERPDIQISSPPEFKGQSGYWTPEDLFVGAAEMCQMLTFLAIAQKQQLPLISYKSSASGSLEFVDGQYRFTRIVIAPAVVVEESASEMDVQAILRDAHKHCLIANSISAVVEVNPTVTLQALTQVDSGLPD